MWSVLAKKELMPRWEGRWRWNKYARAYKQFARYEVDISVLKALKAVPRGLKKPLEKSFKLNPRVKSLFVWQSNKNGVKKTLEEVLNAKK